MTKMEYLSPERLELVYRIPLAEVVVDFFDQLKSRTKGYASLDYEPSGYATADLVRVDVLINHVAGRRLLHHRPPLPGRHLRPAHDREAPRAHSPTALRRPHPGGHRRPGGGPRDGEGQAQGRAGQVLRRGHHPQAQALERQKEGKKRMKNIGRVEVPQEAFISALRLED